MKPNKPTPRLVYVSDIISLTPHLTRVVFSGDNLLGFPEGREGAHVKVIIEDSVSASFKMRSYTIRKFDIERNELSLDFVVNRHAGPATNWVQQARVGDSVKIAGPGPLKIQHFDEENYLLVGDITSVNAINGYVPRFKSAKEITAIISVPTQADIIDLDYGDMAETYWHVEDESSMSLEEIVFENARNMPKHTHVFMGLEAKKIRSLRCVLQEDIGFERVNISAVGYWKAGVDADAFGQQKKAQPL